MKRFLPLLALGTFAAPAFASEDKPVVRFKVDTPIVTFGSDTVAFDDGTNTSDTTLTNNGLTLGTGPARIYIGGVVAPNFEIGAAVMLGFTSDKGKSVINDTENEADIGKGTTLGLLASVSYNKQLGDGAGLFIQPKVGIMDMAYTPDGGDKSNTRYFLFGAEVGPRIVLNKRCSVDFGLEYLRGQGKGYADGDEVEDTKFIMQDISLRTGVSARF